jgi:hypothetical protein
MQTLHLGLPFFASRLATNLDFAGWGPKYARTMEAYEYVAGMWLVGEDMPRETKLTISKTYSFRTAANSQPAQQKIRP